MNVRRTDEYRSIVDSFMASNKKTKLEQTMNQDDLKKFLATVRKYNRDKNLNLCIGTTTGNHVYMVKG